MRPAAFCLLSFPTLAQAADLRVPADYPDPASALAAATACDRVLVGPGTFAGVVSVPNRVALIADGSLGSVTLLGNGQATAGSIVKLGNGSSVRGFVLRSAPTGIEVSGQWTEAHDNVIEDVGVGLHAPSGRLWATGNRVVAPSIAGIEIFQTMAWLDGNDVIAAPVGIDLVRAQGRVRLGRIEASEIGARVSEGTIRFESVEFVNNEAAISADGGPSISGCAFEGNALGVLLLNGAPTLLDCDFVDNGVAIETSFADAVVRSCRFDQTFDTAIYEGVGSASRIAGCRFRGGTRALTALLAGTTFTNNTVLGAVGGVELRGGAASVYGNVFSDLDTSAVDKVLSSQSSVSFNAFWGVGEEVAGGLLTGNDVVTDPLLDVDGVPQAGSPLIDAGPVGAEFNDLDGTRNDIGWTGGPDAFAAFGVVGPDPPVLAELSVQELAEGRVTAIYAGYPGHAEPVRLDWDLDPSDGLQFCDGTDVQVDYTAGDDGDIIVRVRATNADGETDEVDAPLHITNTAPTGSWDFVDAPREGEVAIVVVDASDPAAADVLTYDLDVGADGTWEILSSATPFLEWLPAQSGLVPLVVRVRDDDGGSVEIVGEADVGNEPPELVSAPGPGVRRADGLDAELDVADPSPLDTVAITLIDGPAGMALDGLRLTWMPAADQAGPYTATLQLSDQEGATTDIELGFVVYDDSSGGCSCAGGSAGLLLLPLPALRRRRR